MEDGGDANPKNHRGANARALFGTRDTVKTWPGRGMMGRFSADVVAFRPNVCGVEVGGELRYFFSEAQSFIAHRWVSVLWDVVACPPR
jgi:hypothetical protein